MEVEFWVIRGCGNDADAGLLACIQWLGTTCVVKFCEPRNQPIYFSSKEEALNITKIQALEGMDLEVIKVK